MKICAVSYLNTKPFLYGLENLVPDAEIVLHIPSLCVEHFRNQSSDVALIPVGSLLDFSEVHIIDDFCIGANTRVDSVFLFAQKPIQQLGTIYLDAHSRTSNGLVRVLARYHWNRDIHFLSTPSNTDSYQFINGDTGAVVIGDRAIRLKNDYGYVYDLAHEWKIWTGLPFVFAVWAFHSSQQVIEEIETLKNAFRFGIDHIEEVATIWCNAFHTHREDVLYYYQNNISYELDKSKKEAMELYLHYLASIENANSPIIQYR